MRRVPGAPLSVAKFSSTDSLPTVVDSSAMLSKSNHAISMLGKKFGVMNEFFISESSFLKPHPGAVTGKDRYKTSESIAAAIVCELYAVVPPEYHNMMQTTAHFYKTVSIRKPLKKIYLCPNSHYSL